MKNSTTLKIFIINLLQLMRWHRISGFTLLLWPTLLAISITTSGNIFNKISLACTLGAWFARSCGCIINDICDRNFDSQIPRTKLRPLASGALTLVSAYILLLFCAGCSLYCIHMLPSRTYSLILLTATMIIIYPLSKRFFILPQLFLGLTFANSILIAGKSFYPFIPIKLWPLYVATIFWVMAFDTQYALADRYSDATLGLKSSTILFANKSKLFIIICQTTFMLCLLIIAWQHNLKIFFGLAYICSIIIFHIQYKTLSIINAYNCYRAFMLNNFVGTTILSGTLLDLYMS